MTITPTTSQLRMLASIRGQQWFIRPDAVQLFAFSALEVPDKGAEFDWSDFYDMRKAAFVDSERIGHIQIKGALMNKCPAIYEKLGIATRYETIISEITAVITSGAKGILFHVDSPGGTVAGVIEAGHAIANAGVPTAAHCNGLACSAAYWLASGAGMISATPSAQVGNIGAIISWADCDKFWGEMGITFKALTNDGADLKSTFHLEPDEAQLAFLQEGINEAGRKFRDHVTAGRENAGANLDNEVWRAGWYSGERAGELGLVDDIGDAEQARQILIRAIS